MDLYRSTQLPFTFCDRKCLKYSFLSKKNPLLLNSSSFDATLCAIWLTVVTDKTWQRKKEGEKEEVVVRTFENRMLQYQRQTQAGMGRRDD